VAGRAVLAQSSAGHVPDLPEVTVGNGDARL